MARSRSPAGSTQHRSCRCSEGTQVVGSAARVTVAIKPGRDAARNRFRRSVLASKFGGAGARRGSSSAGNRSIPVGTGTRRSREDDGPGVRGLRRSHAHLIRHQMYVAVRSGCCATRRAICAAPALTRRAERGSLRSSQASRRSRGKRTTRPRLSTGVEASPSDQRDTGLLGQPAS